MIDFGLLAELHIQAPLETHKGDRILLNGRGLRHAPPALADQLGRGEDPDPALYYFREAISFEVANLQLGCLSRMLGTGRRIHDRVLLDVFELT